MRRPRSSVLLPLALLTACAERPPARPHTPEPRVAEVEVVTLQPQTWTETIGTYGVVEAAEEVLVAVELPGHVKTVQFEEGDRVEAGQLLIELDSEKKELHRSQARTARDEAEATLAAARKDLARTHELFRSSQVSRAQLDRAELAVKTARARYQDALAALQLAERELADCRITSPASGLIHKRSANPGETVVPGAVLAVIEAVDTMRVVTYVTEKDINHIRPGGEATVTTPGVRGRSFKARIESLGAKADPRTGNFHVRLTIQKPGVLLRPGMTARATLPGVRYTDAIVIPDSAVVDRGRRRVAYKVEDGKAVEVEPVVTISGQDQLHVLTGLEAGDRLIVAGLPYVADGTPVKVVAE